MQHWDYTGCMKKALGEFRSSSSIENTPENSILIVKRKMFDVLKELIEFSSDLCSIVTSTKEDQLNKCPQFWSFPNKG